MQHVSFEKTLSAAVGQGGTFTISYPNGLSAADLIGRTTADHELHSMTRTPMKAKSGDFSVTFGASNITVTILAAKGFNEGEQLWLWLDLGFPYSEPGSIKVALPRAVIPLMPVRIMLDAPDTADPNGYVESQNLTAAGVFSVDTTVAAALAAAALDGVADVPRNVVAAWTGTAVLTVTGTNRQGDVIVESSASGTSFAGKKAFKTITDISVSGNVTGLTVGTGDVLGLPIFLPQATDVIKELEDNAVPTAGTIVAGDRTTPTATTGDTRGTYDPNSACNGSKVFELIALVRDPKYQGAVDYAG